MIQRVYEHYAWVVELDNDAFVVDFVKKRRMPKCMSVYCAGKQFRRKLFLIHTGNFLNMHRRTEEVHDKLQSGEPE
jgi:hypothetical protein